MEPLAPRLTAARLALFGCLLLAAPGCVLLDKCRGCKDGGPPPPGPVHQVVATWSNKVHYTPDPAKGGAPTPGFVGRMYLFGPQIDFPQSGDGCVTVDLYDDSVPGGVHLEQWNLDKDTLQRLLKQDTIGWGYTLFLPSAKYRPDLARVNLAVRYTPEKGSPMFSPSGSLTLDHSATQALSGVATASAQAPAAAPPAPPAPPATALPMPSLIVPGRKPPTATP